MARWCAGLLWWTFWCYAFLAFALVRSFHVCFLVWAITLKALIYWKTRRSVSSQPASARARIRRRVVTYCRACTFIFLIHSAACGPPGSLSHHEEVFQAGGGVFHQTASHASLSFRDGFQQSYLHCGYGCNHRCNSCMRAQLACLSRNWLITLNSFILEARECYVGWLTPRPSPGVTIVGFFLPVFVVLLPVVYVPCKGFPGEGDDVSFSMASINVTSCSKNFSAVLALGAEDAKAPIGLCLMQETRIHPLKRGNLSKKFEKHGWTLNIGPQPPVQKIRVANGKSTYRQMHGGLAIASRGDIGVTEEPIPKHFGLGNAVQSAICVYDSFTFRVVNCYLPSGHKRKLARQQLMKSTFEYIASVGPGPTFVGGDFNDAPMNNPSISQVFQAGDFCDVVSEFRAARNLEMGYTFSRTKKPSRARTHQGQTARRCSKSLSTSRIDFFLTNSCASQCVTHAWHAYDKIFPNHVPVCIELTIPVGDMKAFLLKGSPQWSFPPLPKTQQEWDARDSLIQPLISTWLPKILPSAMEGNVHEVWELACGATREILSSLASHAVSSTKGNLPEFVRVSTRKPIRQCSLNHIRRNKVLSLFKELERKFDHFSLEDLSSGKPCCPEQFLICGVPWTLWVSPKVVTP